MKNSILLFVFVALLFCTSMMKAQTVDHWETVVYDSAVWRYALGTSDPGSSWMSSGFDDSGWTPGKGGIGYGDNDDRTVISPVMSVFLRITFNISDVSQIGEAIFNIDYDDGYIAYLNGVEIARRNIDVANPVAYDQAALAITEPVLPYGGIPENIELTDTQLNNLLFTGANVLAIEVHNANITSSDISSSAFFSVGLTNSNSTYGPVPSWFVAPFVFTSSMLPIVVMNTPGDIQDEPRIVGAMGIIDNGSGNLNHVNDPFNNYDGKIGTEIRGESSQSFPKKSYSVETIDDAGQSRNVSLLGLPPENDWILYAPYTDKTMMRDVITYEWGRKLGMYASRVRYVEVVINGDYKGVYVLLEKIKRDKSRVDIARLTSTDISGDDLTGGYLLRVDKWDVTDYPAWTITPSPKLPGENDINFQFHDPKGEDLLPVQQNYIKDFVLRFESVLSSSNFGDLTNGYRSFIDIPSFVNFMIVNEIGKNIDGYVFSTYLYKDKDSKDPKLHMGPLWDFNLAYGNVDYLANSQYAPGWTYDDQYRMFWFRRLMSDPVFAGAMKCRWTQVRNSILTNEKIVNTIDSIASVLDEPQKRNYNRWPILDTYVWPNQYWNTDGTYKAENDFLKQWILDRVTWMDENMPGNCAITAVDPELERKLIVYPNPSTSYFHFEIPRQSFNCELVIYNSAGEKVFVATGLSGDALVWDGTDSRGMKVSSGLYNVVIRTSDKNYSTKIIKQ